MEEILRCLLNSAVPVTELNLYLDHIDIVELRQVLPYVRYLEQFIIVMEHHPRKVSAHGSQQACTA